MTAENRRRTGRPPLTDRASLLAAARRIGFADLTVGTVTAAVGVKYSTFYRHFASFEALQGALVDDVLGEIVFPAPAAPWPQHLRDTARVMFEALHRHPGLARAIASLPERPTRLVELFVGTTEVLLAAGFDGADTALGATGVFELTIQPWIDGPGTGCAVAARPDPARGAALGVDPAVLAAMASMADDPPTRWIDEKLTLMIDGMQARLARTRPVERLAGAPSAGR